MSPCSNIGAIMSSEETYCELMSAGRLMVPPCSFRPLIRRGGKPSFSTYSMSAPSSRSALTSALMGRCFMRSEPVSTCSSPSQTAKKEVRKRMAVPAPWMSISLPRSLRARNMTSVSSQSERRCTSAPPPLKAQSRRARLLRLLEEGSAAVVSSREGKFTMRVMLFSFWLR